VVASYRIRVRWSSKQGPDRRRWLRYIGWRRYLERRRGEKREEEKKALPTTLLVAWTSAFVSGRRSFDRRKEKEEGGTADDDVRDLRSVREWLRKKRRSGVHLGAGADGGVGVEDGRVEGFFFGLLFEPLGVSGVVGPEIELRL